MCKVTLKKAMQKAEGVQEVTVYYDAKTAVVTFDSHKANNDTLIKATTDTGYSSSLVTPITL